jgi:D-lactate dehydrogenase
MIVFSSITDVHHPWKIKEYVHLRMKIAIYSTLEFEKPYIETANNGKHELKFLNVRLNAETVALASDCEAVSIFVNDDASAKVLELLHPLGIQAVILRSAGFNNVDVVRANALNIRVVRVPAYSPHAVAEHTLALVLALNRKLIRANARVHEGNFSLNGLVGFDLNGKTVAVIGTGKIGGIVARLFHAFGCRVLAYDPYSDEQLVNDGIVEYLPLSDCLSTADIISLHAPLMPETKYLINQETIKQMKHGVMLINTSRGGLINTKDVIQGLKTGKIGYLGLDVYEEEAKLFFDDHSEEILQDDVISRLLTFKNVLITSHQGFLTDTALKNIAETTIFNTDCIARQSACVNEVVVN